MESNKRKTDILLIYPNDETRTWREHVIHSYNAVKKKRRLKNVTSFTKIACKPNLLHNVKEFKEGGFEQILKQVKPDCLHELDAGESEHFRKIIKRANKLRPYGRIKE